MKLHATKAGAIALGLTAVFAMGGCKNNSSYNSASNASNSSYSAKQAAPANTAAVSASPEDLGKIGAEIKRHPKDAQKILTDHGMDEASFEKAIRSVSSHPDESKRYRDAYKKAGA